MTRLTDSFFPYYKALLCAGLVILLAPLPAAASTLSLEASGMEKGTWSSNPLLLASDAKALWGSTTEPSLILQNQSETSLLKLDTKLDENVFNQSSFNSTDIHATAEASKKNQRWNADIQEHTDYDTTRTSELTNYGLVSNAVRHMGLSVTPQLTFTPTALDMLSLTGTVATSRYDGSTFTNYNTYSVRPSYAYKFDPKNTGIFSVEAQRYITAKNASTRVDSIGPSIGWQGELTPRFSANAAIGAQTTRQYNLGSAAGPWAWQYTYSAGLTFKGSQDTVNLTSSRAQSPYGNGTEALQTSFDLAEEHALNDNLSLNVGASYLTSKYPVQTAGSIDSLSGGTAGATYHATQTLDLTASYRYRREMLVDRSQAIQDNTVILGLTYHPDKWTLWR